ncbi:MAG: response regulator transcription factor [Cryomorphaceae bacterium]|nr:response regulator transcription factor [Cryomorphaceae bacterium]
MSKDTATTILIVDDEPDILEILEYNLKKENFNVIKGKNGKEGLELAQKHKPKLILLDVMMPGMDGIETCEKIRALDQQILIAFLTARGEDYSQVAGFDAGADDYITKPIKPKILVSRIKALLRRAGDEVQEENTILDFGKLVINTEYFQTYLDGDKIAMPRKEFEMLRLLASKPGKVFTRDDILEQVWGKDVIVGDRTIDVHVRKIREKIGNDYIRTIKGVGYTFELA